MSTSARRDFRDPFRPVRRRFERWRSARTPGERIPETLWQAAAQTAREQGVSKTAVALGLNHATLKARIASVGTGARPGTFIPVTLPPFPAGPACVVEVEDGDGTRLRVELTGSLATQAGMIARTLWEART